MKSGNGFGQQNCLVTADFKKTVENRKRLLSAIRQGKFYRAFCQRREQWRMVSEYLKLPEITRYSDTDDLPGKMKFLGSDDLYLKAFIGIRHGYCFCLERFCFFNGLFNGSDQVKCAFREAVMLSGNDLLEAFDGLFQLDILASKSGEGLGHKEWL